jgi:hypothetical protein
MGWGEWANGHLRRFNLKLVKADEHGLLVHDHAQCDRLLKEQRDKIDNLNFEINQLQKELARLRTDQAPSRPPL